MRYIRAWTLASLVSQTTICCLQCRHPNGSLAHKNRHWPTLVCKCPPHTELSSYTRVCTVRIQCMHIYMAMCTFAPQSCYYTFHVNMNVMYIYICMHVVTLASEEIWNPNTVMTPLTSLLAPLFPWYHLLPHWYCGNCAVIHSWVSTCWVSAVVQLGGEGE